VTSLREGDIVSVGQLDMAGRGVGEPELFRVQKTFDDGSVALMKKRRSALDELKEIVADAEAGDIYNLDVTLSRSCEGVLSSEDSVTVSYKKKRYPPS
jgi:hypothetical protein